jgi:thioredoxin-related protein
MAVRGVFLFVFSILIMFLSGCGNDDQWNVDMTRTVTDTNAPPLVLSSESALARAQKKMLLMEFGSSDSCPPCVLLQRYVFSTPDFQDYARSNLLFLRLDYPVNHPLRADTRATNVILEQQFNIALYPTFIVLDNDGKEFWRMPGTNDSGIDATLFNPTNFINLLKSVRQNEK